MNVLNVALLVAMLALAAAIVLCGVRLLRGPSAPDRVLALDTLYMNAVALIVVMGMWWGTTLLFEAALLVAMLGFVSTVALARYINRGDAIE
jgi:multicomponent K+:H+ antiporter subunit F